MSSDIKISKETKQTLFAERINKVAIKELESFHTIIKKLKMEENKK